MKHASALFGACLALFFLLVPSARATTLVPGGTLDVSTTWTAAGSPYEVASTVTVSNAVTLTIEAGATVRFAAGGNAVLFVLGDLQVNGTAQQPVVLEGQSATRGSWYGVNIVASGGRLSRLNHVIVRHGQVGVRSIGPWSSDSILVEDCSDTGLTYTGSYANTIHAEVRRCETGIKLVETAYLSRGSCVVHHNRGNGLVVDTTFNANGSLHQCTIADNAGWGVWVRHNGPTGSVDLKLRDTIVTSNALGGLRIEGAKADADVQYTLFWNNGDPASTADEVDEDATASRLPDGVDPLFANPSAYDYELTHRSPARYSAEYGTDLGGRPHVSAQTPRLWGTIWENLTLTGQASYLIEGDLVVGPGAILRIEPGALLVMAASDGLRGHDDPDRVELIVRGSLGVSGTQLEPVTIEGDEARSDCWAGLYYDDAEGMLGASHLHVRHAVVGLRQRSGYPGPLADLRFDQCKDAGLWAQSQIEAQRVTVSNSKVGALATGVGRFDIDGLLLYDLTEDAIRFDTATEAGSMFDHATITRVGGAAVRLQNVSLNDAVVQLGSSIIADVAGPAMVVSGDARGVLLTSTLVWRASGTADTADDVTGTVSRIAGWTSANPLFADPQNDDFALTHRSPARFLGTSSSDAGAVRFAGAQTTGLRGVVWENLTLPAGDHTLTGDLVVAPTRTLTLAAGARVHAADVDTMEGYEDTDRIELRVRGALLTQGTAGNPARLDGASTVPGAWWGLVLEADARSSSLVGLEILDAEVGLRNRSANTNTVREVHIQEAADAGVLVEDGTLIAQDLEVERCGVGARVTGDGVARLTRALIHHNDTRGFEVTNNRAATHVLDHATISDNGTYGIYGKTLDGAAATVEVRSSLVTWNGDAGAYDGGGTAVRVWNSAIWVNDIRSSTNDDTFGNVVFLTPQLRARPLYAGRDVDDYALTHRSPARFFAEDGSDAGAVPFAGAQTVGLLGVLWDSVTLPAGTTVVSGDLVVPPGRTLTVPAGATVSFAGLDDLSGFEDLFMPELYVQGTLIAAGTPGAPILFEAGGALQADWLGPVFSAGSASVLREVTLERTHRMVLEGDGPTVDGVWLQQPVETGVVVSGGSPTLSRVRVDGGDVSVRTEGGGSPTFEHCLLTDAKREGVLVLNDQASTVTLLHCTVHNTGAAGVRGNNAAAGNVDIDVINSAITDTTGVAVLDERLAVFTLDHVLLHDNGPGGPDTTGTVTETTVIRRDPGYVAPDLPRAAAGSPLIDAARVSTASGVDLDGNTRPVDGDGNGSALPDIGAYEYVDLNPAITATPSPLDVPEGGFRTVSVVLETPPRANVVIDTRSALTAELTVSPARLTFTPSTWATPQLLTLSGVDDAVDDGNVAVQVTLDPSPSPDPDHAALAPVVITATALDNDTAGLIITPSTGLVTGEDGTSASVLVQLASRPTANVTLTLGTSNANEGTVSPTSLVFVPTGWNTPRPVTLQGVDDTVRDGDVTWQATFTPSSSDPLYQALAPVSRTVLNEDDDRPATAGSLVVAGGPLLTSEGGATDAFSVALDREPTATVSVRLTSSDPAEATVMPALITFNPGSGTLPQTVLVRGVDDTLLDGDTAYEITIGPATSADANFQGAAAAPVEGVNTDNEAPGVFLSRTSGLVVTEAGSTDAFSVALTHAPTADVVLDLSSSDPTEGSVQPTRVTFTPTTWSLPVQVVVTGVDDTVDDGAVSWEVITALTFSLDPRFHRLDPDDIGARTLDDDGLPDEDTGGDDTDDTDDTEPPEDTDDSEGVVDTEPEETDTDTDQDPFEPEGTGCGCSTGPTPVVWGWALIGAIGWRRRRR